MTPFHFAILSVVLFQFSCAGETADDEVVADTSVDDETFDEWTSVEWVFAMSSGTVQLVDDPSLFPEDYDASLREVGGDVPRDSFSYTMRSGSHEFVFVDSESGEEVVRGTVELPANGHAWVFVTDFQGGSVTAETLTEGEISDLVNQKGPDLSVLQWGPVGAWELYTWNEDEKDYTDLVLNPGFVDEPAWQDVQFADACYCIKDSGVSGSCSHLRYYTGSERQVEWDHPFAILVLSPIHEDSVDEDSVAGTPVFTWLVNWAGLQSRSVYFTCDQTAYEAEGCLFGKFGTKTCPSPAGWEE